MLSRLLKDSPDNVPGQDPMKKLLPVALAVVSVCTFAGCFGTGAPPKPSVLVYGDSLVSESHDYFNWAIDTTIGITPVDHDFFDTAPCDWLGGLPGDAAGVDARAVVLAFTGNVRDCNNGTVYDAFVRDLGTMIDFWRARGAAVYVALPPLTGVPSVPPYADQARQAAVTAAASRGVPAFDAGASVMLAGAYTDSLPCYANEARCGSWGVPGSVKVRSDDKIHLCPDSVFPCPGYDPGGFRYGVALAGPVISGFH